jgi:polyisoprenoid-binding protein YceI
VKRIILPSLFFLLSSAACCQTYMTRAGFIGFYSNTPLEDIKAENQQAYGVIDLSKKQLAFTVLIKGFTFKKELMQTHFNENYAESDKYPKASFTGTYSGEISRTGELTNVQVAGTLTLHGVKKDIVVPATLQIVDGKLSGHSAFSLKPEDFDIAIPALVRDKIASQISVEVKLNADPIKN